MIKLNKELTPPQILIGSYSSGFAQNVLPRTRNQPWGWYRKARQMRKDPTIALARLLSLAPVLVAKWSYEAKPDAPEGAKGLISEQFDPLKTHVLKAGFNGCTDFGWQGFEKIISVNEDGTTYLKKLKPLLQDITDILVDRPTGAFIGLRQRFYQNQLSNTPITALVDGAIQLDLHKSLLVNFDVEGTNWYGEPMMQIAEHAYDQWHQSNEGAARYDAKMAGSHWIVHYPYGTSKVNGHEVDNFQVAESIILRLESSGAIAVPKTLAEFVDDLNKDAPDAWKVELLTDSGGHVSYNDRMKYMDTLKVRAFGFPERAILEGTFGTKAEAVAHADMSIVGIEMKHSEFCQQLNWHAVNQILRLNYGKKAENSVYIVPSPIADLERNFLQTIYAEMLKNPDGFLQEMNDIDVIALKDRLGVPIKSDARDNPSEAPDDEDFEDDDLEAAFNPDQARDEHGRWGSGGSSGHGKSLRQVIKPLADMMTDRQAHFMNKSIAKYQTQIGKHTQALAKHAPGSLKHTEAKVKMLKAQTALQKVYAKTEKFYKQPDTTTGKVPLPKIPGRNGTPQDKPIVITRDLEPRTPRAPAFKPVRGDTKPDVKLAPEYKPESDSKDVTQALNDANVRINQGKMKPDHLALTQQMAGRFAQSFPKQMKNLSMNSTIGGKQRFGVAHVRDIFDRPIEYPTVDLKAISSYKMQETFSRMQQIGHWPKGIPSHMGREAIAAHELGHVVGIRLREDHQEVRDWSHRSQSRLHELSGYAAGYHNAGQRQRETEAEAFSQMMTAPKSAWHPITADYHDTLTKLGYKIKL